MAAKGGSGGTSAAELAMLNMACLLGSDETCAIHGAPGDYSANSVVTVLQAVCLARGTLSFRFLSRFQTNGVRHDWDGSQNPSQES
jgi:hypothetical protein